MEVISHKRCYYGGKIVEAGEHFTFDGEKPADWMEPVDAKAKAAPKKSSEKSDARSAPSAVKTPADEQSDESLM